MTSTRADIQALRGIAVLAVLGYHAKLPWVKSGYFGVDIFFVVSGFLITRLIERGISAGQFSFAAFYWRRAWRLLPAAYVVFLSCAIFAPWLLTAAEQRDFALQLIGAITFTGNIALWLQTGYFAQAAELKPLLHVWSLAIEEQYYLLLPLAMVILGPSRWRVAAVIATLAGLGACLVVMPDRPGAGFYLLPTRAWELGFGSVVALYGLDLQASRLGPTLRDLVGTICLIVIGLLVMTPQTLLHPGWLTILVCGLTAISIATGVSWLGVKAGSQLLGWFGDRSYSLYLVHWPLLAFMYSANVGSRSLPWTLRLAALVVAVVLAALLYRWVEVPMRRVGHGPIKRNGAMAVLFGSACLAMIAAGLATLWMPATDYSTRLRANRGLDAACDQFDSFANRDRCTLQAGAPRVLLWGDSYAMHWAPGLAASGVTLIQASRASCPPLLDIARFEPPTYPALFVTSCIAFNEDVRRFVAQHRHAIDVVVLASQWGYAMGAEARNGLNQPLTLSQIEMTTRLTEVVRELRKLDKKVVLLVPTPSIGLDMGRCVERMRTKLWSFGGNADCGFSLAQYRDQAARVDSMLGKVADETGAVVVEVFGPLCDERADRCKPELGDIIVYRDSGHLTYEGSIELVRRLSLANRLLDIAR